MSEQNVELWTRINAEHTDVDARRAWAQEEVTWGLWGIPEDELRTLGAAEGLDILELGCGTAYFSARLARAGARVVGVDPTPAQLATARRMQAETGIQFPLVEAYAEDVPLPAASFDIVVSEYGASIWADPYKWIAEAARLLRPAGRLVFLRNSTLLVLCSPDTGHADERLHRPQRRIYRFEWSENEGAVEYHVSHGDWIALLRTNGFEVEALHELYAPEHAVTHPYYDVPAEWGRKWPAEEIWVALKGT